MIRRALASAALAALLGGAASCASVIGADPEDYTDIAEKMCKCNLQLGFLHAACQSHIEKRLRDASEEARAEWLNEYVAGCTECSGVLACFYRDPVCIPFGDGCTFDEECCSRNCDENEHVCKK